ncbi:MAG: sigma-54-dependent Fis family transcriptional regulator [Gluconacetobacter diazotrophicus]|nr:sigma-54-dependent Fis family transcriptional regulator [Gluconacetobacter diazotrophicus]
MRLLLAGPLRGELGRIAPVAARGGIALVQADGVDAALDRLRRDPAVDLVLCQIGQAVPALVDGLERERIAVPVVACGPDADPGTVLAAIRDGARDVLPWSLDPELVPTFLENAAGRAPVLVARDAAMLAVVRGAEQVARSDASVLVTGESGTGKEVVARLIHHRSRRANGPFVALNCAALPEQLLESELFGHEKGAFSGAVARRIGRFEAASGGTLLLDEISEMDVRLQAKLLRAIQEREIDRLGGSAPVRVDVRILATSNRDLRAEATAGRFREDLFFRLNVVDVAIPPLRRRPHDVPVLAGHYLRHYAELNGVAMPLLSEAALRELARQPWRGNVRELENLMHRAVLVSNGAPVEPRHLGLGDGPVAVADATPGQDRAGGVSGLVGRRMEEIERELILETLQSTAGNRTHAAVMLGISIRALRNKLRDYASEGAAVPRPLVGVAA